MTRRRILVAGWRPSGGVRLAFRAKSMSYEQIAATLSKHGLKTSPAGVGAFCRRTLSKAEILREQVRIRTEAPNRPAATAPSFPGLSAVAQPGPVPVPPGTENRPG